MDHGAQQTNNQPTMQAENENETTPLLPLQKKGCKAVQRMQAPNGTIHHRRTPLRVPHLYDTQANEGMNVAVAKVAPKTKTYSTTTSLANRLSITIRFKNLGHEDFWDAVYAMLGLTMTDSTRQYLQGRDKCRAQYRRWASNQQSNGSAREKRNARLLPNSPRSSRTLKTEKGMDAAAA